MSTEILNISLKAKGVPTINIVTNEAGAVYGSGAINPIINFVTTGPSGPIGAAGSDGTAIVSDGSITSAKIAPNSIGAPQIMDGSIGNTQLADNAVYGSKVLANSISGDKLVNNSITSDKILNNSIDATKIANGAISRELLAADLISANEIQNKGIFGGQIANNTLVKAHYVNNSVDGEIIEDNVTLGGRVTMNHLELAGSSPALIEGPTADDIDIKTHVNLNFKDTAGITKVSIDQSGNLAVSGTVDGRDIAVDGAKLDNISDNDTIDWTTSQGASNIHTDNYTDTDTVYDATVIQAAVDLNTAKVSNIVQTTITGNAATATALTSGDKFIDGKVGIGTDIPVSALHVLATTGIVSESPSNASITIRRNDNVAYSALLKYHTGNSEKWVAGLSDSGDFTGSTGNEYFIGTSKTSPSLLINSSGNVGVGTSSPTEKLDVTGNIKASGEITADSITTSGNGGTLLRGDLHITRTDSQPSEIRFDTNRSFGRGFSLVTNGLTPSIVADHSLLIGTTNTDTQIKLEGGSSTDNIQFYSNEVEQMRITTTGVGIGTDSPSEKLDVVGNIAVSGTVDGIDVGVDVAANTAKVGISAAQSAAIIANAHPLSIKILPSDFMPDTSGRPAMIDDTSSDRALISYSTTPLFAYIDIPTGFKATTLSIYGDGTSIVEVYEANVDSATVVSKGAGTVGTSLNFTDVSSNAANCILIEVAQTSAEKIYGGKMTIAAI